jgi:predicted DNA-binding transcriptional regulator AlpA
MNAATHHSPEIRREAAKKFDFSSLSNEAYIRQPQVLEVVPWSAASLWRKVKSGQFPAPVKLSERITAWRAGDLRIWLANQAKGI